MWSVFQGVPTVIIFNMSGVTLKDSCPGNLQSTPLSIFLLLLESLVAAKCPLGSDEEYPKNYGPKLQNNEEFDFIVIGSGSGGSVVANKLSENENWRVLVLEAGGIPSALSDIPALFLDVQNTNEDWQYRTEATKGPKGSCLGFKHKQCSWPRGKVLGGSSSINAMIYTIGNKRDYDEWAKLGNTGWDWESIKEYFTLIENIQPPANETTPLGTSGLLPLSKISSNIPIKNAIIEGFAQLGVPKLEEQNPVNPIGSSDNPVCVQNGVRANTAKAILGAVKNRKGLLVARQVLVQKILIDPKTKTAFGVIVKVGEKFLILKSKKEVILSAGSINSPQLLMLSGIGPKKHLESLNIPLIKDLPVGENLQDHAMFTGFDVKFDSNAILPTNLLDNIYNYFQHRTGPFGTITGPFGTIGITNFLNYINTRKDSKWPNAIYQYLLLSPNDTITNHGVANAFGVPDDLKKFRENAYKYNPGLMVLPILINPISRGKILLKSNKIEDKPLIYSGYFTDEADDDIQIMLESIRFFEKLLETDPVKKYNPQYVKLPLETCNKLKFRSDDYWKCALRHLGTTIYHPTSTCSMGPNDDGSAVVDPRLRVYGIKNLRVVDASIMPYVTSGNTHAPTLVIGYKAGLMITEDWLANE